MVKVKVKKLYSNTKFPEKKYKNDACYDCFVHSFSKVDIDGEKIIEINKNIKSVILDSLEGIVCNLGFATQIPDGYFADLRPRSGWSVKMQVLSLTGTIDSGYRNEWRCKLANLDLKPHKIEIGDKVCQFMIVKLDDTILEEGELDMNSERGLNGIGSSGFK